MVKLKWILRNLFELFIFFLVIVLVSMGIGLYSSDLVMQGRAEGWMAEQKFVEHVVQPGDTWEDYYTEAPEYIWNFELSQALRDVNKKRGYVSWTGVIRKTLITGSTILVPVSHAETSSTAKGT